MASTFVPLLTADGPHAATGRAFRARVLAGPGPAAEFRPLRPVKNAQEPALEESDPAAGRSPCAGAPSLAVRREGDVIVAIQVTCRCGEVTEIQCDY